ncbi:MAG: reverse transcriptase family protein [Cyanobacteriota/Melainabacteria group bacterium]|nr:RNA-directed DNA polymerase [Cyanobacteria bacterium HKST-UBA01]MCB9467596.1 RNA-directed DNA polymerase [Candidatus Obscuribacterales bacterium]
MDDICEELGFDPQFLYELADASSSLYKVFDMPKRSGGFRTICVPADKLKNIQRLILDGFLGKIDMPAHMHGGIKGRSIATNAEVHVGKPLVVNIDLKDFFQSISVEAVRSIFSRIYNLDENAAEIFVKLTTYGNSLPQGAPTSSLLASKRWHLSNILE